jgi:hypothetical protein
MEAIGEHAADEPAGRAVKPGLSVAAMLKSRGLRSVSDSTPADHPASDGGTAAGFSVTRGRYAATAFSGGHTAFTGGAVEALRRCLALAEAAIEGVPEE